MLLRRTEEVFGRGKFFAQRRASPWSQPRYFWLIYPMGSSHQDMSAHQEGVRANANRRFLAMFTRTTFALAVIIGTASGALAANKHQSVAPNGDVYDARSQYVGADPDANVRFGLRRDAGSRQ